MTATTRVFWLDTEYDRANASNGVSRFAAYVRQAADGFRDDVECHDVPAAALAARAWNTACPPVMTPGFVAWHPRVLSARADRDDWDGDLLLTVDLISALPDPVTRAAGWSWQSWQYTEWSDRFDGPQLRAAGRDKALLPTVSASILLRAGCLFPSGGLGAPDWGEAAAAVRAMCQVLNDELGPIVAALDQGR